MLKPILHMLAVNVSINLGNPETLRLLPSDTEVILDASRIGRLRRITITPDCHLDSNDFKIGTDRIYLAQPRC